jgi:hypothetical protein
MTITLDIRPEVEAELARRGAVQGRAIEAVAAALLEVAVNRISTQQPADGAAEPARPEHSTGQSLIDAFAGIRGSLTDEETDRMPVRDAAPAEVVEACERLKTFGKTHGLSLGGMSLRELRHEARP